MTGKEKAELKTFIQVNAERIRKNIAIIDDVCNFLYDDIKKKKNLNSSLPENVLKGVFWYYVVTEHNKDSDKKITEKVPPAELIGREPLQDEVWRIFKKDKSKNSFFQKFYNITEVNFNKYYDPNFRNIFWKWVNNKIAISQYKGYKNDPDYEISDFKIIAKKGNTLYNLFSNLEPNNFFDTIILLEKYLAEENQKKIEAYNIIEKKDDIITKQGTQFSTINRRILLQWQSETFQYKKYINGILKSEYYENFFRPKYPELKSVDFKNFNNIYHVTKHRGNL